MSTAAELADTEGLSTLRDFLRYAVSAFNKAGLVYGHGTDNALDEAAFLLLTALHLSPGQIDPWLECRLTNAERAEVLRLIRDRITTRKPAPYLVNCAWISDYRFFVDERVIVPRSFIGELLCRDALGKVLPQTEDPRTILDLCTGSGCLAILAALIFPEARIVATDISQSALDVARRNVADYGLEDRISLAHGDLFAAIKSAQFDLIISNPPYVTENNVRDFPPEFRAEPALAHAGGADGLDIVRRILEASPPFLTDDGNLIVEVGQAQSQLNNAFPHLPFLWLDTETSEGEVFTLTARDFPR